MKRVENIRYNIGYGAVLVSVLAFSCYLVQAHCIPDNKPCIEQCTSCLLSNRSTYSSLMNYVFSFVSDLLHKSNCHNITPATTTLKSETTTQSNSKTTDNESRSTTQRGNTDYCYTIDGAEICASSNPKPTENICENCV